MRRWPLLAIGLLVIALAVVTRFQPGGLPYTPGARFSDAVTAHYPAAVHLHRAEGLDLFFPYWSETFFLGQPFSANPLNKTAYPPQWFAHVVDPVVHLNLMIVGHLVLAAVGMWTWTRALGLSVPAAALATLAYTISPRLMAHMGGGHLDVLYALAWFPWLMWTTRDLLIGDDHLTMRIARTALIAGLIVLADVRVSLFALMLAGMYGVVITTFSPKQGALLRLFARGGEVGLLVALLTIGMIGPLLLVQPYLSRAVLTQADAAVFAMQPIHLIGMIYPPPGGNLENIAYFGIPVLLLAVFAMIRAPRRHALWIGAITVAMLYALGEAGGLWTALVTAFPGLLWFRVPARAWFIPALLMPLLAGYGLEALLARAPRVNGLRGLLIGIALIVTAGDLLLFAGRWAEWRGREEWLPPSQVELAETLIALNADRVYSPTYSLETQTVAHYDLRLLGGVDPFQSVAVNQIIQSAGGIAFEGYSVVQPPLVGVIGDAVETANRDAIPDPRQLATFGVSHIVSAYDVDLPDLERSADLDAGIVYRNLQYDRPFRSDATKPFFYHTSLREPDFQGAEVEDRILILMLLAQPIGTATLIVCCVIVTRYAILERTRRRHAGRHDA